MPNAPSNVAESNMSCKEWDNGVSEQVTQPIDWCASTVPVLQKHTTKTRICLNLKKLNKSIE